MKKLLFIEDDKELLELYDIYFRSADEYKVFLCETVDEAIDILSKQKIHCIITDIYLNQPISGLDLIKTVKDKNPSLPIIVVSGSAFKESVSEAINLGCQHYFIKPVTLDILKTRIEECCRKYTQHSFEQFNSGDIILREKQINNNLFYIESGKVRVCRNIDDKDITLGYLEAGDYFGENSFFNNSETMANIVCQTEVKVEVINRDIFLNDRNLTDKVIKNLLEKLRSSNDKLSIFLLRERIQKKLYNTEATSEIIYFDFKRLCKLLSMLCEKNPNIADLTKDFNEIAGDKLFDINILVKILLKEKILVVDELNKVKMNGLESLVSYLDRPDKVICSKDALDLAQTFYEIQVRPNNNKILFKSKYHSLITLDNSNTKVIYIELKKAGFFSEDSMSKEIIVTPKQFENVLFCQKILRKLKKIIVQQ